MSLWNIIFNTFILFTTVVTIRRRKFKDNQIYSAQVNFTTNIDLLSFFCCNNNNVKRFMSSLTEWRMKTFPCTNPTPRPWQSTYLDPGGVIITANISFKSSSEVWRLLYLHERFKVKVDLVDKFHFTSWRLWFLSLHNFSLGSFKLLL